MPRPRPPAELIKRAREAMEKMVGADEAPKKVLEELKKNLDMMKATLFGSADVPEPSADAYAALAIEACGQQHNFLLLMVQALPKADFEGQKDIVQIFAKLLRREVSGRMPTVEYVASKPEIIEGLVNGYDRSEIALNCGQMLRECIRHEPLASMVLNSEMFYRFFGFVQLSTFDIAADAFATFKDLLTKHKILCANFLEQNYEQVFERYIDLLKSENYVTKRQSLKLLGELLLDRANFSIMTKYIANPENLKLMMNMLRDNSKNIQFEAFHVFKVFVANPTKSQPIMDILLKNRDKLVTFLEAFHQDRAEDEQFLEEKKYLIKQIKELRA